MCVGRTKVFFRNGCASVVAATNDPLETSNFSAQVCPRAALVPAPWRQTAAASPAPGTSRRRRPHVASPRSHVASPPAPRRVAAFAAHVALPSFRRRKSRHCPPASSSLLRRLGDFDFLICGLGSFVLGHFPAELTKLAPEALLRLRREMLAVQKDQIASECEERL